MDRLPPLEECSRDGVGCGQRDERIHVGSLGLFRMTVERLRTGDPSMGVAFLGYSDIGLQPVILLPPPTKIIGSTGQPLHCVDLPDFGSRVLKALVLFSKSTIRKKPQIKEVL